jgi:hypothetical protein
MVLIDVDTHVRVSLLQTRSKDQREKTSSQIMSNTSDLFKSSSQASLLSRSRTFSELIPSVSLDHHTPTPTKTNILLANVSTLPNGHSMMEFALQNFHIGHRR